MGATDRTEVFRPHCQHPGVLTHPGKSSGFAVSHVASSSSAVSWWHRVIPRKEIHPKEQGLRRKQGTLTWESEGNLMNHYLGVVRHKAKGTSESHVAPKDRQV